MTTDIRACETCGRERDLRVYALPGIPMSVGNCRECWEQDAMPTWVAEATLEMIGGPDYAADWFLDSRTWRDGAYVRIGDL
jgi:hypothetical protein